MNWVHILDLCIVAGTILVMLFLTYKIGYSNGHYKGYLDALNDIKNEMMIAKQKETEEG